MTFRDLRAKIRRYGTPSGLLRLVRAVRDRNIVAKSPLFDREWYLREHPDVGLSGVDPVLHYLTAGQAAGLSPSAEFCGPEYTALHRLPRTVNPVVHYETIGRKTGLATSFLRPEDAVSTEETLRRIRAKADRGEPLRAVFLVASAAMFPARPLFDAMLRIPQFAPEIVVIPDIRWPQINPLAKMGDCERELLADYPDSIHPGIRPDGSGNWPDVLENSDFVVYPSPYDLSDFHYNPRWSIGRSFLSLHVNYAFYRSLYDRQLFAKENYRLFWKVFLECAETVDEYKNFSLTNGSNGELVGYIKMDRLANIPSSASKTRKSILICPHHSVSGGYNDNLSLSNFQKFSDYFLRLPAKYPNIDFIFRPHPFLFQALAQPTAWGQSRVEQWIRDFKAHPNAIWSSNGDYFSDFMVSDGCIQDCGSFLVEYFYSGKPCCYLLKRPTDIAGKFAPLGRECLDHCYLGFTEEDINRFIIDVIVDGKDELRDKRDAFRRKIMVNYPHAAEHAVKSILYALESAARN